VHTDAVQAVGRIAVDFAALGVDTMSLSAHKIGGPKGVGALIIRDGSSLAAFIKGGGQERRRRAGTENVAAVAGFGAAAEMALADLARIEAQRVLRDHLEGEVMRVSPQAVVLGAQATRIANTSCVALPGQRAETLVIKFDLAGVAVSAGAACSSGKVGSSHVIEAMGFAPDIASSAIRVSIGSTTTARDIAHFTDVWTRVAAGHSAAAAAAAE